MAVAVAAEECRQSSLLVAAVAVAVAVAVALRRT
jgi:hypothetical protein